MENINRVHDKLSIRYGSEMISKRWPMYQQFKSQSFTTDRHELLALRI
ncbi:DUF4113 domain-containing protein [Methylobacter sp.]